MSKTTEIFSSNLLNLISDGEIISEFGLNEGDFIRVNGQYSDKIILANKESYNVTETKMIQKPTTTGEDPIIYDWDEFNVYQNPNQNDGGNNYYLKIPEISENVEEFGGSVTIDYLNQLHSFTNTEASGWIREDGIQNSWLLTEISPTRHEVRLKLLSSEPIDKLSPIIPSFNSAMNTVIDVGPPLIEEYKYDCVLSTTTSDNVIVNWTWDRFTHGDSNQSLILKLLNPLSIGIPINQIVTINRKILKTQIETFRQVSRIESEPAVTGLSPNEGAI